MVLLLRGQLCQHFDLPFSKGGKFIENPSIGGVPLLNVVVVLYFQRLVSLDRALYSKHKDDQMEQVMKQQTDFSKVLTHQLIISSPLIHS